MSITNTVSVSEARPDWNKFRCRWSETRKSVTVFKGSTPYLVISPAPLAKEPNEETLEAFRELEEIRKDPSHRTHEDADELFAALGI